MYVYIEYKYLHLLCIHTIYTIEILWDLWDHNMQRSDSVLDQSTHMLTLLYIIPLQDRQLISYIDTIVTCFSVHRIHNNTKLLFITTNDTYLNNESLIIKIMVKKYKVDFPTKSTQISISWKIGTNAIFVYL